MSIIAKYKFDKSIYENLIPEFNEGYTGYTISDEIDSENSNHVIRTIECDVLPTKMLFGGKNIRQTEAKSLLDVILLNTSELTDMNYMFKGCNRLVHLNLPNLNTSKVTSIIDMVYSCGNLTSIDVSNWDVSNVIDMTGAFAYNNNLHTIQGIETWNVSSKCVNLYNMFINSQITSLDLSNWDTSKVTDMGVMFASCTKLTSLDLSNWDTSKVSNMYAMFSSCTNLTSIGDVSKWDTSKVTSMEQMFFNCQKLTSLDMSNWDTGNVTNMYQMFHNCHAIKSVGNIRNFVTNKVTTIKGMFENCYVLKDIDTSNWDVSNVDTMEYTFEECQSLTSLDLSNWNIKNTCVTIAMLTGCGAKTIYMYDSDYASVNRIIEQLPQVDNAELYIGGIDSLGSVNLSGARAKNWSVINKYKVAKYKFDKSIYESLIPVFNDGYTGYTVSDEIDSENSNHIIRTILGNSLPTKIQFGNARNIGDKVTDFSSSLIEIIYLNTTNLDTMMDMFAWCNQLIAVNTEGWDTSKVTNMSTTFSQCYSLSSLDVSNFNTSNVTNMMYMFADCVKLTTLDVSNFNTSKVTRMDAMFYKCNNLTSLDVSNFDTSNVTLMSSMFYRCESITSLDVSKWDTKNVINMDSMFYYCKSLENLNVSNFDTSKVTTMGGMFCGCINLPSLDVSRFNTSNVMYMDHMFNSCKILERLDVSHFDTSKVTKMEGMFNNMTECEQLDLSNFDTSNVTDMTNFLYGNYKIVNLNNLDIASLPNTDVQFVFNSLERLYLNNLDTLNLVLPYLTNRVGNTTGYIVTTIKDQISEETINTLAAKNWVVKDLVAQYVYDTITYENLLPTFNTEFTSDKYEIYDSVSDIVIDDIVWTPGCINNSGENSIIPEDFPNAVRTDSYLPIVGNVSYIANFDLNYSFYDENKNHISTTYVVENTYIVSPINAKYVRLYRGTLENTMRVTAKIITRNIESKNGDLPSSIRFGNGESVTDITKSLLKILSLNTNQLNTLKHLCTNCNRVTEINTSNWDTSNVTSMISTFYNCGLLSKLDVSKFDVSKVESLNHCFNGCNSLTEIDVSNWKTTEVLNDVSNLFYNCYLIKKIDLSGFNTSNVINFTNLFCDCHALEEIEGLYSFDTSNAEGFQGLFARCYKLQHINGIENWNTSKVTNFHYVFGDEQENPKVGIDITNWSLASSDYYTTFLSNLTNLRYLKCDNTETITKLISQLPARTADKPGYIVCRTGAANLDTTALTAKNWIVIKYLVADYTFDKTIHVNPIPTFNGEYTGYTIVDEVDSTNANHVNRIIVSNTLPIRMRFGNNDSNATSVRCMVRIDRLDCSALSDAYLMFKHCANLTGIYTRFNVNENLSTVEGMFSGCASIKNIDVTGLIGSNVTVMKHLFDGCVNLSTIKGIGTWNTSGSTDMRCLFEDCISLTSLDVSNFNTSNVTDMKGMFGGVDSNYMSLTEIKGLENFNTSKVKDMSYMFCRCNKLTEINVSNFDTTSVEIIEGMFMNCESVTSLDVGHFNISKVTNLWSMFASCTKIRSLDVSKWDTSNVTNMVRLFNLCIQLRSLDVSNWDVGKVTNLEACFGGCTNLPKLDVSRWNTSNVTNMVNVTQNLYKAASIDLNNWDTSKAYNIGGLFEDLGIGVSTPKKIDLSNWDTSSAMYIGWLLHSSDAIAGGWKYNIQELNITNMDLSKVINTENLISPIYAETLENPIIRCNVVDTIKMIADYLPSRASLSTPGYIVTTMKDEIDEPTVELLTSKNWLIREMIAQYIFDANTYEDLMPEFNPEFTEDKYEVYDSVSDIVIDNMVLEVGAINGENGYNINNDSPALIVSNCNRTNYLSIIPNTTYSFNYEHDNMVMFDWYDENKKFISQEYIDYNEFVITSPINAKYLRMWANKRSLNENKRTLTAKLVTRTIESKNGDLPTLMRFGYGKDDIADSNIPKHLSLIKILGLNTKELTTAFRMFKYCKRLSTVQSNWNTSKITDMFAMFFECIMLTSIDVSNWDTSNVTDMHGLFHACNKLTSLDVSKWDVRKVKKISQMFLACESLKSMDLSNWQTDSLEQMYRLFQGCHNLVSVNINNLNISKVKTLEETFKDCHRLASLDLSNWDTSSINNIRHMFTACRTLTSLDLNNWDTSNVTYMDSAFYNCENLVSVNIGDWDTSNVIGMNDVFHNCKKLTSLDVSRWNVGNVIRMANLFNSCNELASIDVSNWNTSKVENMGCLFGWCYKLKSIDLSNWDTSKVVYMEYMFIECYELTSIGDTSNWDTGNVTNMEWMFDQCYKLSSLNVSNWDTGNVTDITYMFDSCHSLTSLDVSKWDTGNVRGMRNTFNNCRSLTSLDVNNWDVSKVGEMYAMFSDCVSLTDLDLTNWNTSKVNNIGYMFDGKELNASINMPILDLTSLDWSSVTEMEGLFYKNNAKAIKLPRIINPNLPSVISERTEGLYGLFYCPNLVSLDFGGLNLSNLDSFDIANKHLILEHVPKLRYIRTENPAVIAELAQYFPARTEAEQGYLITKASVSDEIRTLLAGKYWNVVNLDEVGTDVAIYKFDKSIYKSLVPEFDNNFADWFMDDVVEDEVNAPNIVTRTVRSMGGLPTLMRFGNPDGSNSGLPVKYQSLINVLYINTESLLNHAYMFNGCIRLQSVPKMNINNKTNLNHMFCLCNNLTSLDVSDFDTSNVTNMGYMFYECKNLTSLDVSNFDTSNVNDMQCMFNRCYNLTSLDVSNFDTSKVITMYGMFYNCNNLTSLDVSNWDTSNVTNMQDMFYKCTSLTSLDVSNFDTSNVKTMHRMFSYCHSLTSLDVSNWNVSKVYDIAGIFWNCYTLTELDLSNWDTTMLYTESTNALNHAFCNCRSLTSLDLSNFITKGVVKMDSMLDGCSNLVTLDISNFDMNDVDDVHIEGGFIRGTKIEDIGMIYCDFKTVEKVAKQIPTTNTTTIWVGNHIDINGLPQYDHITYKVYEVEDKLEVELSSPLLEGDRLEIIDGDLYHYHKCGIVDLSTIGGWSELYNDTTDYPYNTPEKKTIGFSSSRIVDRKYTESEIYFKADSIIAEGKPSSIDFAIEADYEHIKPYSSTSTTIGLRVLKSRLVTEDVEGFEAWLKVNPVILTYELRVPYYELVKPNVGLLNAEQGLYLNISDSVVPVVNHQDLCTLKLNYLLPNVEYKVKFKANNSGSIAINLGGTLVPLDIVEGWNEVMVTTPETLVDEYLKVNGSEGIKIQNVMVIDSNKDFDYFKGMNNTFDEIPVKNICTNRNVTSGAKAVLNKAIDKGRTITVVGKAANSDPITLNLYNTTGRATGKNLFNPEIFRGAVVAKRGQTKAGTLTVTDEGHLIMTCNNPNPGTFIDMYMDTGIDYGTIGERVVSNFEKYLIPVNGGGIYTLSTIIPDYKLQTGFAAYDAYIQCYDKNKILISADTDTSMDLSNRFIGKNLNRDLQGHSPDYWYTQFNLPEETAYVLLRFDVNGAEAVTTFTNILFEKGDTGYEPFRNHCNENPIAVTPDVGGKFAVTIRADRDWVDKIVFDADVNDLVVLDGDMMDCYPDEYLDPSDVSYLVEFKTMGSPYGFGKKKLI